MIHSSTTSRPAGHPPTQAPAQAQQPPGPPPAQGQAREARKARAKPAPEGRGEAPPDTSTRPLPAARLKQRHRAAPSTEGRQGPAAAFFDRTASSQPPGRSVIGVQFDDTTRTAIIALDSGQYFADRLASGNGAPTPALMEELGLFARKMTLEGPDATAALVYSTFLDHADAPALAPALVKPVMKSLLQGPPFLPAERMAIAVKSICALFPDCRMPDEWLRVLIEAARESLAPGKTQAIADVTTAILFAASVVLPSADLRAAMNQAILHLALQACAEDPEQPIGLVAWMNGEATHSQPMAVAARVLDEMRRFPDMAAHPVASVMVTLSAGTVMPLSTDGTPPASPLSLILPWALQLPQSHRAQALAGISQGMSRAMQPAAPTLAHLETVLRVIGEVESMVQPSDAQGWVGVILGQTIVSPPDTAAPAPGRKGTDARSGPARKDSKDSKDTPDGKAAMGAARDERWAPHMLAGLRAVLVGPRRNALALEHRLPTLGRALAHIAGGRGMPVPTLKALVEGLAKPPIPVRDACQVLAGVVRGVGGTSLPDEMFAAIAEAIGQADRVRGALLACHFCHATGGAGAEGHPRSAPIDRAAAAGVGQVPAPLALGWQLADAPLDAVRRSGLPAAEQLQMLEVAFDIPGGLGEAARTAQVFECGLVAAEDPDFAFEAALRLCDQLDTPGCEPLVRQLRAALVPHVVAPASLPGGAAVVAARLDSLARVYERAGRHLWKARPQPDLQIELDGQVRERKGQRPADPGGTTVSGSFLASEAALMRGGPRAAQLEPLAARLDQLGTRRDPPRADDDTPTPSTGH